MSRLQLELQHEQCLGAKPVEGNQSDSHNGEDDQHVPAVDQPMEIANDPQQSQTPEEPPTKVDPSLCLSVHLNKEAQPEHEREDRKRLTGEQKEHGRVHDGSIACSNWGAVSG